MTSTQREMERANDTQKQIIDERRLRMAYVRGDLLINWFKNGMDQPTKGFITFIEGIPENTLLLGVDYHIEMAGFKFLLGSLEFDKVPEGQYPEALNITIRQFNDSEAGNEQNNNSL